MSVSERFHDGYVPEPNSGCWLWTKCTLPCGYGWMSVPDGWTGVLGRRQEAAHRVSYRLYKGDIPEGLEIDHLCRVRSCVNPDHLEAVTRRENVLRGVGLAAINAVKTHCKHGHLLSGPNLRINIRGSKKIKRSCKKCEFISHRRRHPLSSNLNEYSQGA